MPDTTRTFGSREVNRESGSQVIRLRDFGCLQLSQFLGGPPRELALGLERSTVEKFINGDAFDVIADWSSGSQAHRFLKDGWTGRTEFSVASPASAFV